MASSVNEFQTLVKGRFRQWDLNSDGSISRFELRTCLGARGIREDVADEAFRAMDLNEDDAVDPDEFAEWFQQAPYWAFVDLEILGSTVGDGSAWDVVFNGAAHVVGQTDLDIAPPYIAIGGSGYLEVSNVHAIARNNFTMVCWIRRLTVGSDNVDRVLLGHDNSSWLVVDGVGRIGISHFNGCSALSEDIVVTLGAWTFVALIGSDDEASIFVATAACPVPKHICSAQFCLSGSRLNLVGRTPSMIHVSEIAVIAKRLSTSELCSLFESKAPQHGILPGFPQFPYAMQGRVTCGQAPLGGVFVQGDGAMCGTTTDESGFFALASGQGAIGIGILTFCKSGFATSSVFSSDAVDISEVQLHRIDTMTKLNSSQGGTVTDLKTGSSVILQADALCFKDGSSFDGVVSVELGVVDAADQMSLASMPGDFTAILANGSPALLQSLGAVYIGLRDEQGNELDCKPGYGMTVIMNTQPLSFDLDRGTSLPGVYMFDNKDAKWKETGLPLFINDEIVKADSLSDVGELDEDSSGLVVWTKAKFEEVFRKSAQLKLTGVERSGWWNCDAAYRAALLSGQFDNTDACAGGAVWSVGIDYSGRARSVVDVDGSFCVMAQCHSQVTLELGLLFGPALREYRQYLYEYQWLQGKSELNEQEKSRSQTLRAYLAGVKFTPHTFGSFSTGDPGKTQDVGFLRF